MKDTKCCYRRIFNIISFESFHFTMAMFLNGSYPLIVIEIDCFNHFIIHFIDSSFIMLLCFAGASCMRSMRAKLRRFYLL